jgi:hypothetical protein
LEVGEDSAMGYSDSFAEESTSVALPTSATVDPAKDDDVGEPTNVPVGSSGLQSTDEDQLPVNTASGMSEVTSPPNAPVDTPLVASGETDETSEIGSEIDSEMEEDIIPEESAEFEFEEDGGEESTTIVAATAAVAAADITAPSAVSTDVDATGASEEGVAETTSLPPALPSPVVKPPPSGLGTPVGGGGSVPSSPLRDAASASEAEIASDLEVGEDSAMGYSDSFAEESAASVKPPSLAPVAAPLEGVPEFPTVETKPAANLSSSSSILSPINSPPTEPIRDESPDVLPVDSTSEVESAGEEDIPEVSNESNEEGADARPSEEAQEERVNRVADAMYSTLLRDTVSAIANFAPRLGALHGRVLPAEAAATNPPVLRSPPVGKYVRRAPVDAPPAVIAEILSSSSGASVDGSLEESSGSLGENSGSLESISTGGSLTDFNVSTDITACEWALSTAEYALEFSEAVATASINDAALESAALLGIPAATIPLPLPLEAFLDMEAARVEAAAEEDFIDEDESIAVHNKAVFDALNDALVARVHNRPVHLPVPSQPIIVQMAGVVQQTVLRWTELDTRLAAAAGPAHAAGPPAAVSPTSSMQQDDAQVEERLHAILHAEAEEEGVQLQVGTNSVEHTKVMDMLADANLELMLQDTVAEVAYIMELRRARASMKE